MSGSDALSFSTETATMGGSNETCVSQLAVKALATSSCAHVTAYRPYVKRRSTAFLAA